MAAVRKRLARRIVRAVTADLDRRGPRTALSEALLSAAGVVGDRTTDKDLLLDQLVSILYAIPTPGIARFAPLVFDLVDSDPVAWQIADNAADALADTVLSLWSADPAAPLVIGGSVLFHQDRLRCQVIQSLRDSDWTGPVSVVSDGTVGAICMNLRTAGVTVQDTTHARIAHSLNQIRMRH